MCVISASIFNLSVHSNQNDGKLHLILRVNEHVTLNAEQHYLLFFATVREEAKMHELKRHY